MAPAVPAVPSSCSEANASTEASLPMSVTVQGPRSSGAPSWIRSMSELIISIALGRVSSSVSRSTIAETLRP